MDFIKVFLFGVDRSKSARNQESSSRGALNSRLASVDSGLQLNLEIALSGASAKVKPPTGFSARPKVRWDVGWRNRGRFYQHSRQPYMGL